MILTWNERCEKFADDEIIPERLIQEVMQEEIDELRKELALQKLSDIGQEIENHESAIYATGYWKGIEYKRMRELTDEEILELSNTMPYANRFEFARAILKKATEK